MTNQANELFELCKKVYELTGWERNDYNYGGKAEKYEHRYGLEVIYTSDYLLEKLPRYLRLKHDDMDYPHRFAFKLRASTKDTNNWRAGYYNSPKKQVLQNLSIGCHADTPLKALLKLTIALSEAGELNDQSS